MIVQFKRKPHGKTANLNDNDAKDRSEIYELNLDKTITLPAFTRDQDRRRRGANKLSELESASLLLNYKSYSSGSRRRQKFKLVLLV